MSRRLEEGQTGLDPLLGDFTSNRELTPVRMNLPGIDLNRSAIDYLIRYVLKNADGKWDYPRSLFLNLDPFYHVKTNDEDEILFPHIFSNRIVLMPRGNIAHCTVRCTYKKRTSCCVDLMKLIVNKYNTEKNWFFDPGTQYTHAQVYQERRFIV